MLMVKMLMDYSQSQTNLSISALFSFLIFFAIVCLLFKNCTATNNYKQARVKKHKLMGHISYTYTHSISSFNLSHYFVYGY